MGYIAWLQRGSNKLRLDTDPYEMGRGFVPPAIAEVPNVASGTSANKYGGGKLISKRADSAPYSFSVRIMGNSNGHNEALIDRLERFVQSGTEAEPVYFCWHASNNIPVEPMYGQWNATRRAKVITGSVYKSAEIYFAADARSSAVFADVNLLVNPPEGKRQRVATATGGIIEDTIGSADGTSRGVIVAEATTNVITNPIFGHATPLNDWTTGSDTISEVVTDGDYVLFGDNAVRLTRKTSGSTFSFYESINVGNTNTWCLSCYAKKPDGSAVTSSDIQLRYGGTTSAPSFQAVGNGWYRAWKTFTGIASAQVTGCTPIVAGASIYIDGWQLEEKAYPTPLAYGDLLGCAWSSTAHDSSSTRTAGSLRIPAAECVQPSNFTWWVAFKANNTFSEFSNDRFFLREDATNSYIASANTGQCTFADGTNGANGATTAITAGDIIILHATMDSAGMKLYRNGAQSGNTQATFVPLVSPTYLYIGTEETPTQHSNVTVLGAGTYNRSMTATEIAADYTNMVQAAGGLDGYGGRVDWLPYLWTKDGDDVVDNCDDATRDNWCVIGSVPGSVQADTEFTITPASPGTHDTFYLVLNPVNTFTIPTSQTYKDASGTAEATASGGEVLEMSGSYYFSAFTPSNQKEFTGNIHFLARVLNDAGPGYAGAAISYTESMLSSTNAARIPDITCPDDTTYNLYYLGHIKWQYDPNALSSAVAVYEHQVGGAKLDYFMAIPGYLARIYDPQVSAFLYLHGSKIYGNTSGYLNQELIGDIIELRPNKINMLYLLSGGSTYLSDITETTTYTSVYVTPRWALA